MTLLASQWMAARPQEALMPFLSSAHAVAQFVHARHGWLVSFEAALFCAAFSVAVVIGVYFLLDRL